MTNDDKENQNSPGFRFDNTYSKLPEQFFEKQKPMPVKSPELAIFNHELAKELGLNEKILATKSGAAIFGGNEIPEGAEPIAQAYAGHQFGHFTMLGDGRAVLLGEHVVPKTKQRFDIQLKGSGQTPFSRRGDGRAALAPMLREYIISEAMHGLGIPTTRSLAVVTTGEITFREKPLPGAVLTRVAASHIRVGTFEYAAAIEEEKPGSVKTLADYTIQRHFPEILEKSKSNSESSTDPYLFLLHSVMERQAELITSWMGVGFIHGVMNTDNMALSGETIDYGPCAFMDQYSPTTVFSSIDRNGRYAYGNQQRIAGWNLARLAEALLPLFDTNPEKAVEIAKAALEAFPAKIAQRWNAKLRAKLGLENEAEGDSALIEDLLKWMEEQGADYTNTFRALSESNLPADSIYQSAGFKEWHSRWQSRKPNSNLMRATNPAVIPRNHRVEEALAAAQDRDDFTVMERLLEALKDPYADSPKNAEFRAPGPSGTDYQTFCGT